MVGICESVPAMSEKTAARLDRALSFTRLDGATGDQAALIAKRDALLALTGEAA
ncbi:MAG: Beta-hexosaminidase, partial [Pseudomonadota bacterium]